MIDQERLAQLWTSVVVEQVGVRQWDLEKLDDCADSLFAGTRKPAAEEIAGRHAEFFEVVNRIENTTQGIASESIDVWEAIKLELKTILNYANNGQIAAEPFYPLLVGLYYAYVSYFLPEFPSLQQAKESALWGIKTYETNDLDPLQDMRCWLMLSDTMWLTDYNGFRNQVHEQFPTYVKYALKEEHETRKQERREAMKDFGSDSYRSPSQREADRKAAIPGVTQREADRKAAIPGVTQREADRKAAIPGIAPAGTTKKEESGGCYVATSVYGSYDCPEVWVLRRYRDGHLAKSLHGRAFIRTYYAISPTLVRWFGDAGWFKRLVRPRLDAMVAKLENDGYSRDPYDDQKW